MYYFEDTKRAAAEASDVTIPVQPLAPAVRDGGICVAPAPMNTGVCFLVRTVESAVFSFTAKSEFIMQTLCLTVTGFSKHCRNAARRMYKAVKARVKNVVNLTAPRFLRL